MKKEKLKLSLKKEVISNLQAKAITGGEIPAMSEPMCPYSWNCPMPETMTCCHYSCSC